MTYYRPTLTAAEYKSMARHDYQEAVDSFDRCDTDGFLSQWASDTMARLYDMLSDLAANGGKAKFPVLCDLEGNEVDAIPVDGAYGRCWGIRGPDGKFIGFAAYCPKRPATLAKKGYQEIWKELPALIVVDAMILYSRYANVDGFKPGSPKWFKQSEALEREGINTDGLAFHDSVDDVKGTIRLIQHFSDMYGDY